MNWKTVWHEALAFLRWLLLAVSVGLVVGLAGALFDLGLHEAAALQQAHPWLLYLLPLGGVFIAALYRLAGQPDGGSTNSVFLAVRGDQPMPLRTAPLIVAATALTHLLGGSAGREGAALQLGGSVAGPLGRRLGLDRQDLQIFTMCGMSAAFSALFGTPLAAAVFALEVVNVGQLYYAALVPCVVSALVGLWLAGRLGVAPTCFSLGETVVLSPVSMAQVCVLGALCAVLSAAFCILLHQSGRLYRKINNAFLRSAVGGTLVVGLTLLVGTRDYNGAGMAVITRAVEGQAAPWAFAFKMLFTALTLGAGFKGGEIVPTLFTGATFGCAAAPLLGLPAPLGAALGMASLFCGVTNCPITAILLAVELFGGQSVPLFALACAVAYMLSGYFSLYSEQKFLYSKFRAELIDRKAH